MSDCLTTLRSLARVLFLVGSVGMAWGQQPSSLPWPVYCLPELAAAELFAAGDVDVDGIDDFVVRHPSNPQTGDPTLSSVELFSGATGDLLWSVLGSEANDGYGGEVAPLGNFDGDEIPDVLIQSVLANGAPPQLLVLSGLNGLVIGSVDLAEPGSLFVVGDLDGDEVNDVVVRRTSTGNSVVY